MSDTMTDREILEALLRVTRQTQVDASSTRETVYKLQESLRGFARTLGTHVGDLRTRTERVEDLASRALTAAEEIRRHARALDSAITMRFPELERRVRALEADAHDGTNGT